MKVISIGFLLLAILPVSLAQQDDVYNCVQKLQSGAFGTSIGLDLFGRPVANISEARAMSYSNCVKFCGSGRAKFPWPFFIQETSAWLLPWFALVSQLPFGAEDKWENVLSILHALGSPATMAYSLSLTLLNTRWLARSLLDVSFPNAQSFLSVFAALQQVPISLPNTWSATSPSAALASLIVLPANGAWWRRMSSHVRRTRTWSIPAFASIFWAVAAFLLTIADSFNADSFAALSDGYSIAGVWMWLLPVVAGWLRIGSQNEAGQWRRAIRKADTRFVAAPSTSPSDETAPSKETASLAAEKPIIYARRPAGHLWADEHRTTPLYNGARAFRWSQQAEIVRDMFRVAEQNADDSIPVDSSKEWTQDEHAGSHLSNRLGNEWQVVQYCASLGRRPALSRAKHVEESESFESSRWAEGIWERVGLATVTALGLQWLTAAASIVMTMVTPTAGLGCRSGSVLLYALVATSSFFMHLGSSVIAHSVRPIDDRFGGRRTAASCIALVLSLAAKTLAVLNSIWLVLTSLFHFTNVYDTCWCEAVVLSRGSRGGFITIATGDDLTVLGVWEAWIASMSVAAGAAALYAFFVYLMISPERDATNEEDPTH